MTSYLTCFLFMILYSCFLSESINDKEIRIFTLDQLKEYNGKGPEKPIYFALLGEVFDVTESKNFYGADSEYSIFAGKDITRAIALWSKEKSEIDRGIDISGLKKSSIENLNKTFKKFKNKYKTVGIMDYKEKKYEKAEQNSLDAPEVITRPTYSTDL